MKDRNGKALKIGDRVFVLPRKDIESSGPGFVRRICTDERGNKVRVDNGKLEDVDFLRSESWTWSSWCRENELELIA